jgi:hypothetical protein
MVAEVPWCKPMIINYLLVDLNFWKVYLQKTGYQYKWHITIKSWDDEGSRSLGTMVDTAAVDNCLCNVGAP